MGDRSVPRGKYCRRSRLVFSLVPRCQGLCGSQKYTCTSVATVNSLCLAISSPRSHVSERRRVVGSLQTCLLNAATTTRDGSYAATCQQQLANGGMWPAISAPNLMLGLPGLPSAPDVDLFRGRKPPPLSLDHK